MLTGLIATFIGMTGMGLIAYIDDQVWFILISSLLRLVTGIVNLFLHLKGSNLLFYAQLWFGELFVPE